MSNPEERLRTISDAYAREPERTLVISPDNQSRAELNRMIHGAMQARGHVDQQEHQARVLVPRQDITGADRQWAGRYERGDVVRYSKGSQTHGIRAGDYARVERADVPNNRLIVARQDGGQLSYDPRRLQGVTVYREVERALSAGDRVQFTAPDRSLSVANRELGTIEGLDAEGKARVRLDSGRTVSFAIRDHPHLDHGYAVTSHSSQGQTADRVLVHVDSDRGAELVNRRFAYVAVSRARHDAHIYTNDRSRLPETLSRDGSHRSAIAKGQAQSEAPAHANTASATRNAADTARTRTPPGHDLGFSR